MASHKPSEFQLISTANRRLHSSAKSSKFSPIAMADQSGINLQICIGGSELRQLAQSLFISSQIRHQASNKQNLDIMDKSMKKR
ncbi:UNKNOWN [Stylonychia lemnae]|uniref:Uncharacterized protein n=1 Tax=Stylonychia lemnae TaxID=5949 RepID=A0A078BDP8_STYLE|nr:UNKNOWN [Stylonychia lemnae]|eukprot:CDW91708.1 UNKNOWN [Stylonychia lemnae]